MSDNNTLATIADLQKLVLGPNDSISQAMLKVIMTQTIGMSMYNAVTAQQNAQTLYAAASAATCARLLSIERKKPETQAQGEEVSNAPVS